MKSLLAALVAAISVRHTGALHQTGNAVAPTFGEFTKAAMIGYIDKLQMRATECQDTAIHLLNPANVDSPTSAGARAPNVAKVWGYDFRGCYGETVDLLGRAVCGTEALLALRDSLIDLPVAEVYQTPGFIIKPATDDAFANAKVFLPLYGKVTGRRDYPKCHRTGLAPVCGVLEIFIHAATPERWLVMRKVEIPEATGFTFQYKAKGDWGKDVSVSIGQYFLKGPQFAGGGEALAQMPNPPPPERIGKMDIGFRQAFPKAIDLDGCGSRAAAAVLVQDTMILRDEGYTDYSLIAVSYKAGENFPEGRNNKPKTCVCGSKPVFPLILDGTGDHGGSRGVRFALAIVGYLETGDGPMLPPISYRVSWMEMWPAYFSLPKVPLDEWETDLGGKPDQVTDLCALEFASTCGFSPGQKVQFVSHVDDVVIVHYAKKDCRADRKVLAPQAACSYEKAITFLKRKLKAVLKDRGESFQDQLSRAVQITMNNLKNAATVNPLATPVYNIYKRIVRRLAN